MAEEFQRRQTAFKVRIADILNCRYVKEEGYTPNYIEFPSGQKVSRVNIIGTVVGVPSPDSYPSIMIDDGTGKVMVRSFDGKDRFGTASIGDVILIIGRPREYGSERYIVHEIIKRIDDPRWIDVRKLELGEPISPVIAKQSPDPQKVVPESSSRIISDEAEEVVETANILPRDASIDRKAANDPIQDLLKVIRDVDKGSGAAYEDILQICGQDKENLLKSMLEQGEIFEIRPGRLKVLE